MFETVSKYKVPYILMHMSGNPGNMMSKTNYENDYLNIISDSNLNDGMISLLSKEPNVIGLCCGSTPFHIKYLKSLIKSTR